MLGGVQLTNEEIKTQGDLAGAYRCGKPRLLKTRAAFPAWLGIPEALAGRNAIGLQGLGF